MTDPRPIVRGTVTGNVVENLILTQDSTLVLVGPNPVVRNCVLPGRPANKKEIQP